MCHYWELELATAETKADDCKDVESEPGAEREAGGAIAPSADD